MTPADLRFAMLVGGSPRGVSPELLWELADGTSLVVAVDSGGDWCQAAGLIPDLLVGDMDSVQPEVRTAFAAQEVEEVIYPVDKSATDLELALQLIQERGFSDLVVTNILGGRVDHELAALGNLAAAGAAGLAITVVEPHQTLIFLNNPGARQHLQLGFAPDTDAQSSPPISLIPWGGAATVSATGFKWELQQAVLEPGQSLGVSNLAANNIPLIELDSGALIVVVQTPAV